MVTAEVNVSTWKDEHQKDAKAVDADLFPRSCDRVSELVKNAAKEQSYEVVSGLVRWQVDSWYLK